MYRTLTRLIAPALTLTPCMPAAAQYDAGPDRIETLRGDLVIRDGTVVTARFFVGTDADDARARFDNGASIQVGSELDLPGHVERQGGYPLRPPSR